LTVDRKSVVALSDLEIISGQWSTVNDKPPAKKALSLTLSALCFLCILLIAYK
jgi:hypothetical protein